MDAKLIEDARAWQAERIVLMSSWGVRDQEWITSNETAFDILNRLAEQPLEGDDL